MNNVVYMFKCQDSTITIKGKINSIVIDSCKKCSILLDSLVSSIEFVNCQSVQMQVLGIVPIISIDKTDGCQMYLSKESIGVEIISSKSSEMNVMIPTGNGDYVSELSFLLILLTNFSFFRLNNQFPNNLERWLMEPPWKLAVLKVLVREDFFIWITTFDKHLFDITKHIN